MGEQRPRREMDNVLPLRPRKGSGHTKPIEVYEGATLIRAQLRVEGGYTPGSFLTVVIEETLDKITWSEIGRFYTMDSQGVVVLNISQPFSDTLRIKWEIEVPPHIPPVFSFGVDWRVQ
jgi:hypothetical protein